MDIEKSGLQEIHNSFSIRFSFSSSSLCSINFFISLIRVRFDNILMDYPSLIRNSSIYSYLYIF
jgi:hypothetical protein